MSDLSMLTSGLQADAGGGVTSMRRSSLGRFGGRAGSAAFTGLRWITLQTAPRHCPF